MNSQKQFLPGRRKRHPGNKFCSNRNRSHHMAGSICGSWNLNFSLFFFVCIFQARRGGCEAKAKSESFESIRVWLTHHS